MVEIPNHLECVFSASVDERGESYSIEVPQTELEEGSVTPGETYRVVVLETPSAAGGSGVRRRSESGSPSEPSPPDERTPPVEKGEVCEVTIETLGDQGDGIAKIDRGYVVIVPGTRPDDEVTVEIHQVRENVAFAEVDPDSTVTDEDPANLEDSLANEVFDEDG